MKKTIKYLQDGEYHYATVKDVGDLEQLKTQHKEDLVTALNEIFTTGGDSKTNGYDDLVKKVNDTQTSLNGINSKVDSANNKINDITSNGGGTNLIVQSDLKPGYLDRGSGSTNNGSRDFHSDNYIPTNGATVFTFSSPDYVFKGSGNHTLAMYDSDKNFLGYQLITSPTQTLSKSNTTYIRFSINFVDEGGTTDGLSDWLSSHRYMLEKGTVAHDWSPSPEDVATDISNVNTKIDQTANGINNTITDINGKVIANDEAIAQAKKDLQDALTQFQTFNDEIDQAKKDAETKLADAKQSLKDEFNTNLADAQKANQKQLEDKVATIQGNLDTTSNTLNDVKTQLTNAKLDYGTVNVSIQKLNDTLSTKLSSTDLDPLKTSIQSQETEIQQTKNTLSSKAGKAEFDVLTGRVSTAESKIKQQADEISLGVKKSELNGAIDNYQIEGINRLRNTLDFDIDGGYWKLDQYSINSNTDVHPYDQAHDISALVLQKAGSAKQDVDFTNEDLGQSFVVSMWNKKDAQPQVWYGNTQLTNRQVAEIKGDYERSFFTFIPTNVNVKTIMFKYDAGTVNQLIIGEPKLELGTKPKAYAPNPNDEHKQIVNTKAELKIASDKIESAVEKQTKTDDNVNQLASRVTQTEQGITATNDLITKTKDGLIKDYTGKIDASAKALSSTFEEKTNEKIGQITDSGENLILNSAFTNEADRKDKWQNISDKVTIVDDGYGLMWAHLTQSGLTADSPISLTSNYFPIKQGKVTVGVDIKSNNPSGLSGAKILVLQTYNANKQRVDFTELSLENMGLTISQLADGQSHRGVYRLGNDRSDAVYMTVKAVLPRNGSIYFTNFSAKLSSIDNGGYTPNADDLKRQILNQKTQITQNSQQISLKASSTELRDVRTIVNGAVSVANQANSSANTANTNAANAVSVANNANNNANQAKSNANSAVTTANSAKSTADNANNSASSAVNTANNANTTANSAKNKIDAIQTQLDQARTDIQSTLTVANNGITAATNLKTTYDNYVQKNDANIKLLGDRITNEVSKITSNGGGRNLLQGTGTASGDVANGGVSNYIIKGAFNGYDAIKTNTAWDERYINLYSALGRTNAKAGDWFTLSVYVKADKQIDTGALDVFRALGNEYANTNDGPLDSIWMSNKPITTQWQQYAWSFQINDISLQRQNTRIEYNYDTGDNWIYWAGWMLEKGTVAHDWSPAPEDTDSAIETVSSKIDQTADHITSTINSTKQDLQGQINSANTKITQTANSITEQLKSYSKTGDMQNYVNTTVQKTADGINSEVSDVRTTINTVNTKVEQYKTGINQTATGMNLLAQVITGNESIDVTKSNIGIDPSQIKIASNKIVIDGNTSINGTLNVPNVVLKGESGFIDLSGDNIVISDSAGNSKIGISAVGGIMLKNKTGDSLLSTPLGIEISCNTNGQTEIMGRITSMTKAKDTNQNGIGIILERRQTLGAPYGGDAVLIGEQSKDGGITASMVWDATGTLGKGFHWYDNQYVQAGSTITIENSNGSKATQDELMMIGRKTGNSTQDDYFQPTLMAGHGINSYGDSGLTFYWNSVKAFGTFDLRDTHVLGNRNTHFSVETTFDTDSEANMCFTWTSRSDLWNNSRLPMLARADWWTSPWGSCGILFANGQLFYVNNDGHTYKRLN